MSQSFLITHSDPVIRLEKVRSVYPNAQVLVDEDFIPVEETRNIKTNLLLSPQFGEAVYYIGLQRWAVDTQNTLLKLLEEPAPHVTVILGSPSRGDLLPTVLSRLTELVLDEQEESGTKSKQLTKQDLLKNIEKLDDMSLDEIISIIRADIKHSPNDVERVERFEKMLSIASHKKLSEKQIKEGLVLGV